MFTVKPDTVKQADSTAVSKYGISALTLMQCAAKNATEYIIADISQKSKIVLLCGKGNNGGDGYEIARLLSLKKHSVCVVNVFDTPPTTQEALNCYNAYIQTGSPIINAQNAKEYILKADVIIDAVFGVGFYGKIDKQSPCHEIFELANSVNAFKIAIDTPSGINCENGTVSGIAFKADLTITISLYKTGLFSYPAKSYCGKIQLCEICFPNELLQSLPVHAIIPDDKYISDTLPQRPAESHKGTFGKLTLFCGSPLMTGAPFLACMGALRTGAGLVTLASDEKTLKILQSRLTEPIFFDIGNLDDENLERLIKQCDSSSAVLVGCGLGHNKALCNAVLHIIKNTTSKLIIDADGINALCDNINILREAKQTPVITPHPAEFSRISGKSISDIQAFRIDCAKNFSQEYGCITVLKGAGTVVASPDGRLALNTTGNPGLAKGGSGDVLAGVIASLICQGTNSFDASVCGAYLHGKAADILEKQISQYGFLPSDLPLCIAKLLP